MLLARGHLGPLAPCSEGNGVNRPLKVRRCRRLISHADWPLSSDCCGLQVTAALDGRAACVGFITVTLSGTAVAGRSRSRPTQEVEQRTCEKKVGWRDENAEKSRFCGVTHSRSLHLTYTHTDTHTIYYSSIGHNAFPNSLPIA